MMPIKSVKYCLNGNIYMLIVGTCYFFTLIRNMVLFVTRDTSLVVDCEHTIFFKLKMSLIFINHKCQWNIIESKLQVKAISIRNSVKYDHQSLNLFYNFIIIHTNKWWVFVVNFWMRKRSVQYTEAERATRDHR